jgi:ubiquinone/menaquinone biosynthesis C-methylase UbiE
MPRINSENFYKNAIKKHGLSPMGVCWLSYEHQQIRFDTIRAMLPEDLSCVSLVDAGCGFGDFFTYLQNTQSLPQTYIGIDSIDTMCEIARKKTSSKIIHADIAKATLPTVDYYICSGALNLLTPFESHLFIRNCYKSSKKGFIFNALCGDIKSETYNYLSREIIKKIATELQVTKLIFTDNYLDNDITVGFFS